MSSWLYQPQWYSQRKNGKHPTVACGCDGGDGDGGGAIDTIRVINAKSA